MTTEKEFERRQRFFKRNLMLLENDGAETLGINKHQLAQRVLCDLALLLRDGVADRDQLELAANILCRIEEDQAHDLFGIPTKKTTKPSKKKECDDVVTAALDAIENGATHEEVRKIAWNIYFKGKGRNYDAESKIGAHIEDKARGFKSKGDKTMKTVIDPILRRNSIFKYHPSEQEDLSFTYHRECQAKKSKE